MIDQPSRRRAPALRAGGVRAALFLAAVSGCGGAAVASSSGGSVELQAPAVSPSVPDASSVSETPADQPIVAGALLPLRGSPRSRRYAELLMEGVELARSEARGAQVRVVLEDNGGTPEGSEEGILRLATAGAELVLGPLAARTMLAAARAKPRDLPLFSPTAETLPRNARSAYSLAAGNARAGRALAEFARARGFEDAVVIHPSYGDASPRHPKETEAIAFTTAFVERGGRARRIAYPDTMTTFTEPLTRAWDASLDLLFVAAPLEDLNQLVPQIGLFLYDRDEAEEEEEEVREVQVAGGIEWTDPDFLDGIRKFVPLLYADTVYAISARAEDLEARMEDFRRKYEARFQKTLRDEAPAVGYDLLGLAVQARQYARERRISVAEALERMPPYVGITGRYAVSGGRIEALGRVVRITGGESTPIGPSLDPA